MSGFLSLMKKKSKSVDSDKASSQGFHDGYVYKIISREDQSVVQVEIGYFWTNPSKQCQIVTGEDEDSDNQRFLVSRIQEREEGGEFQVQSIPQRPNYPVLVWSYIPSFRVLTQNPIGKDNNQLWCCEEIIPGSRYYQIKPTATNDLCLTNMGDGEPIALRRPTQEDLCQQWILEPMHYTK